MHQTKLLLIYPPYLSGAGGQGAPPPSPPAGRVPARVSLKEPSKKKKIVNFYDVPKGLKRSKRGKKRPKNNKKNKKSKL